MLFPRDRWSRSQPNFKAIDNNLNTNKPNVIVANTIKGKGINFFENKNEWHHSVLSKKAYQEALESLNRIMEIEKKLKMMSTIGMRASFGLSCLEFVKQFPDMVILTSDVSTSAGLDRFRIPKIIWMWEYLNKI